MFVTKIIKKSTYLFVGLLFLVSQSNLSAQVPKLYSDTLNFGNIEIGSAPISILDTLENTSNVPVDIINIIKEGPSANLFNYNGFTIIPAKDKLIFEVIFPTRISGLGRKEAKFIFRYRVRPNADTLVLFGNIIPAYNPSLFSYQFSIPQMSHKTGDTFKLPVIIDKYDVTDSLNLATIQIRFNQSMMALVNESDIGTIKDGYHTITRNIRLRDDNGNLKPLKVGDTLFSLDVIATLGDSISTQIDFLSANVDGIGAKYKYRTTTTNGSLSLSDVLFKDEQPRLVVSAEQSAQIQLSNGNVLTNSLPIDIQYQGNCNIKLYNAITGQLEGQLSLATNSTFEYKSLTLTKDLFPSKGTYLILLENEFGNASSIIMVE